MTRTERAKWILYRTLQILCRTIAVLFRRLPSQRPRNIPETGGLLVCANHQSYIDPVIVGMAFNRSLQYVARANLFRNFFFGGLIRALDAIPLERGGSAALRGLLETVKRLRNSKAVLIFPEGTPHRRRRTRQVTTRFRQPRRAAQKQPSSQSASTAPINPGPAQVCPGSNESTSRSANRSPKAKSPPWTTQRSSPDYPASSKP